MSSALPYTPYFCEENAWHRCKADETGHAVFISNELRCCPMWSQRAAPEGEPVFWDYHVIFVAADGKVWDPDHTGGMPVSLQDWLSHTFPFFEQTRPPYLPMFRPIEAHTYVEVFGSDRSHMKDEMGEWLQTPPDYPCIGSDMTLPRLWDSNDPWPSAWVDLTGLLSIF